jgi:hypothetical protein
VRVCDPDLQSTSSWLVLEKKIMAKLPSGGSKAGKAKFAAHVDASSQRSGAAAVRRRVEAQRTRLARAVQRAADLPAAKLAVHLDGASALAEPALAGDELAATLRLAHLRAVHRALLDSTVGDVANRLDDARRDAALALHAPLVLALLDEGDAAEARLVLEALERTALAVSLPTRDRTTLAYSRALVEYVDRLDADAEGTAGMRALDAALAANPYVGRFLAHLDIYARVDLGDISRAATAPSAFGAYEGSVEEACAYVEAGVSPWLDFLDERVDTWVAAGLARRGGAVEAWPPRCCSAGGARFQAAFVEAAELAAEADAHPEEASGEEADDSEEEGEEEESAEDDSASDDE